jgi:hypothetical protein
MIKQKTKGKNQKAKVARMATPSLLTLLLFALCTLPFAFVL